jgi:hypothetical protein
MNAPVTGARVTTCVRYELPGAREVVREVPGRDPGLAAWNAPDGAQAYQFYDEITATARVGGEEVFLRSHPFGVSARYGLGGSVT